MYNPEPWELPREPAQMEQDEAIAQHLRDLETISWDEFQRLKAKHPDLTLEEAADLARAHGF